MTKLQASLEGSSTSLNNLGPLDWLTNPLVFWPFVGLVGLALLLHLFHLLKGTQTSRDIDQLRVQQNLAGGSRAQPPPGRNVAVDKLTEQVSQQSQGLSQFSTRLNQLENRLTLSSSQVSDAVHAVALTANWVGQSQLREAGAADAGSLSETARASLIAMLERYREPLRVNASRVEPLAQALAELVEKLEGRAYLSPELLGRVQTLYQDIGRFDQWHTAVSQQLTTLQRGSFSHLSLMLKAEQQRLIEEVKGGSISIAQMVQKSRALLEQYFPDGAGKNGRETLPSLEQEPELKKNVADAPEYLMDWFNNLFQLQCLALAGGQAARSTVDAEIGSDLAQVQNIAREVLGKFDIQPEAIQVGQTSYDRRLHEATMVRQATQFPINTVIEVHRCGFRRMSTGEVLRRPQVVVAGAAST
ncbi:MAG: nucleotide exchange factor GrpE [Pyrinomonadaceae bacterium]